MDLQPYVNTVIQNTNEIIRDGKNLFVVGNFLEEEVTPAFLLKMNNCRFFNNELIFDSIEETLLPISRVHGTILSGSSLFMLNRPISTTGTSIIVKVSTNDIQTKQSLVLSGSTEYLGRPTDLGIHSGSVYTLIARGGTSFGYVVKIASDLSSKSIAFTAGNVSTARRIRTQSPFLIHNNEMFIPTINNATQPLAGNSIGMSVYSMTGTVGTIKREVAGLIVSSGETTQPFPHWMGIYNNKILLTNTGSVHKFLARFDATTLALEGLYQTNMAVTDDNSIFSDGYAYINGEYLSTLSAATVNLLKIKYNNFSDVNVEISNYNDGFGSYGSLNPTE